MAFVGRLGGLRYRAGRSDKRVAHGFRRDSVSVWSPGQGD